jgi:ABC-type sugar transport system ATPase subunit
MQSNTPTTRVPTMPLTLEQAKPLLEMTGITKRFPGVIALDQVSFAAYPNEVHALMGENGAGKSTLMKILTGVYTLDAGSITLEGRALVAADPRSAQRNGLAIIHQELNQVPELSAFENFFLGREQRNRFGMIDNNVMRQETARWLRELGLEIDPDRQIKNLRVAERQLLEIAKAISMNARVLVMDEPTTALNAEEVSQLFAVIERLRDSGMAIIYISHRMDEIFRISDRITVLRDGKLVGSEHAKDMTRDSLIAGMVGRELKDLYPTNAREIGLTVLRVDDLNVKSTPGKQALEEISFHVQAGEIVGLAGLLGAGRTEVLEAIYGVPHASLVTGKISVGNFDKASAPHKAIEAGIGYVTEDRKGQSLILTRSVLENVSLATLGKFTRGVFLDLNDENKQVGNVVKQLRVKTPNLETSVMSLSGGNQQKVVLAKFLMNTPKLFLLDEPTQGIDVGAKAEIYTLIDKLAQDGTAVLLASSDMPELLALCDRILVMCEGRIAGELSRAEATQEKILDLATRFSHHESSSGKLKVEGGK